MIKKISLIFVAVLFVTGCEQTGSLDVEEKNEDVENIIAKEIGVEEISHPNAEVVEENGQKIYINNKFEFKVKILPSFSKIEYLPDDIGMFMRHDANAKVREKQTERMDYYTVEIGVTAFENVLEESDLSKYVLDKYPGYSIEFFGSGIFIDERDGDEAVRHYFLMSEDKKYIYEAYLKVPAFHYALHKGGFDDFVKTIEFF